MAFVKILSGGQKGEKIEIDRDKVVIGRSSKNVVCINDPSISGEHCCILREGRIFTLQDLSSTNGTRLNDVGISEYGLSPKDVIKVGAVELLFDGKDIDPPARVVSKALDTQITVKIDTKTPPQHTTVASPGFTTKKNRKFVWPVVIASVGLLVVGALVWFLFTIFAK